MLEFKFLAQFHPTPDQLISLSSINDFKLSLLVSELVFIQTQSSHIKLMYSFLSKNQQFHCFDVYGL